MFELKGYEVDFEVETETAPPKDKFLTAEELKLTERQHIALIKTLALMESGGINHEHMIDDRLFAMNCWADKHSCGTICCIGGTASLLDGGPYESVIKSIFHDSKGFTGTPDLYRLFYDWNFHKETPVKRAAKQLRTYLESGKCPNQW